MSIDSETAIRHSGKYPLGPSLAEGKTKVIYAVKGTPTLAIVVSKDDITAGDGAKHDLLEGKAEWATETTCNVFELLRRANVPVAFIEQDNVNSFIAPFCTMLPYEVVVRREAHGSFLKRNPNVSKGTRFDDLIVEFYLKTSGRVWKGTPLSCDDPLLLYDADAEAIHLYRPDQPLLEQSPFLSLHTSDVWSSEDEWRMYPYMTDVATRAFIILEAAWKRVGGQLADYKVEFGLTADRDLRIADVIDNDSWRVIMDGAYVDKQVYRDGGELDEVAERYARVAHLTALFLEGNT